MNVVFLFPLRAELSSLVHWVVHSCVCVSNRSRARVPELEDVINAFSLQPDKAVAMKILLLHSNTWTESLSCDANNYSF